MKKRVMLAVLATVLMVGIPSFAGAALVYETTGWISGEDGVGLTYSFVADVSPYNYVVTLSDLSNEAFFGFDFLFLSITTATDTVGSLLGPGSLAFEAMEGETYFANIFGKGGGDASAGLFGLEVKAVPVPSAVLLLGTGLIALVSAKRRKN